MDTKTFLKQIDLSPVLIDKIIGTEEIESLKDLKKIYFFTGKGARNENFHLGHLMIFKVLEKISQKYPVCYQLSGDQKRNLNMKHYLSLDQALILRDKLILELSTFKWGPEFQVIDNLDLYTQALIVNCANYITGHLKIKTLLNVFGNLNVYSAFYVSMQLAPVLLYEKVKPGYQCVIVTAEDQKPYFLVLRDIAAKLNLPKPIIVILRPLKDTLMDDKMSSSKLKYTISASKGSNYQGLKKTKSAPFINGEPDYENDFIAHLLRYLISIDYRKEVFEDILNRYRIEKSTLKTKEETILRLKELGEQRAETHNPVNLFERNFLNSTVSINFNIQAYARIKEYEHFYMQQEIS